MGTFTKEQPGYRPRFALWCFGRDMALSLPVMSEMCLALARVNLRIFEHYPNTPLLIEAPSSHPESPNGRIFYKDDSHVVCDPINGCTFVEDDWCDAQTILAQGYGDCEELVAYFVADCWRTGRTAVPLPRCYKCKPTQKGQRTCTNCGNVVRKKRVNVAGDTWHIQALLDGGKGAPRIVDISRELGMPPHPDGDDAVVAPYLQTGLVRL